MEACIVIDSRCMKNIGVGGGVARIGSRSLFGDRIMKVDFIVY
jgi:hypothetical protein